jgi:WD40 repeat protein
MAVQVEKIHTLIGHHDCVYALNAAGDRSHFFSAAGDGMVVRWDLHAPEEGELIAKLTNSIYALHQLPNTNLLAVGHNYEGIHLLDLKSNAEISSLKLTEAAIFDIQSHEQDLLVVSGEGLLQVIDLPTWTIKRKLAFSEKSARVIAINSLHGHIAVGYSDHYIRVFSLSDYTLIAEFQAHQNSVFALHYTPDNRYLISGSRDARLKAWDVTNSYAQASEVAAHLFAINHIIFSPSGEYFATASMDKSIKIWDANELKLLKVIDKGRHAGHGTSVNKLLWTSFNNQLVSASDDRTLSVWQLKFEE